MAGPSISLMRLLSRTLHFRPVAMPASSRFLNTNAIRDRDYDSDDSVFDADHRLYRRRFIPFSDVFDPFSTRCTLSQILNTIGQFPDSPVASAPRCNWNAKETADGLQLRVDMPGLGKEDVKVTVEQNALIIKGEGKKEFEDEEAGGMYSGRIELPDRVYKTNAIKAEMKFGVLKVFVPKIKEEERSDVFHVNVA